MPGIMVSICAVQDECSGGPSTHQFQLCCPWVVVCTLDLGIDWDGWQSPSLDHSLGTLYLPLSPICGSSLLIHSILSTVFRTIVDTSLAWWSRHSWYPPRQLSRILDCPWSLHLGRSSELPFSLSGVWDRLLHILSASLHWCTGRLVQLEVDLRCTAPWVRPQWLPAWQAHHSDN